MKESFAFFICGVVYLAILYTLVRPGSKGTVIIGQIATALDDLVRGASGETYSNGQWSAGS